MWVILEFYWLALYHGELPISVPMVLSFLFESCLVCTKIYFNRLTCFQLMTFRRIQTFIIQTMFNRLWNISKYIQPYSIASHKWTWAYNNLSLLDMVTLGRHCKIKLYHQHIKFSFSYSLFFFPFPCGLDTGYVITFFAL